MSLKDSFGLKGPGPFPAPTDKHGRPVATEEMLRAVNLAHAALSAPDWVDDLKHLQCTLDALAPFFAQSAERPTISKALAELQRAIGRYPWHRDVQAALDEVLVAASSERPLGTGANGLRWFLETFLKALNMHNGHGTPSLQRAEAYALEAEAKLMLAGHSSSLSATRPTGLPLLFNVFNMIAQDRDEDWNEQWRELMKAVELELTRAGYTMPKAGGDYCAVAPARPTDSKGRG